MRIILLMALAALLGTADPVRAQFGIGVRAGDRVRIDSESHSGIFVVVRRAPDTLVLRADGDGAPVRVPLSDLRELAVDTGPRSAGAGALRGGIYGLLIGGVSGAVLGIASGDDECDGDWCLFQFSASEKAAMAAVALGAVGGGLGLIIGSGSPGTNWERLPLPHEIRVLPARGGGMAVTARLRF